jgi:Helix-turn-helix domain
MSAKQTGLVWELQLPHKDARVLMAMADYADQEGNNVYPGVPLLAGRTGYTTRQVRRILAIL